MFDDLLLLRNGGQAVFHGDVGENCSHLVRYFESKGAEPVSSDENPANWMLRVAESSDVGDLAELYLKSEEYAALRKDLLEIERNADPKRKIEYETQFARPFWERQDEVNRHLQTIYWRSPSYNLTRLVVSLLIATILGLPFVTDRESRVYAESDMRSRVSVVFLTFMITGVLAQLSVLPVMQSLRDIFYRHRAAGMYSSLQLGIALGVVEKWFIVFSTLLFCTVFLSTSGMISLSEALDQRVLRCISFWVSNANGFHALEA